MNQSTNQPGEGLRGTRLRYSLATALIAVALTNCNAHKPTGQEITAQDLNAEARGEGLSQIGDPAVLMQKVVARVLFAQDAHARGLDRYPAYPSELARLQQSFLAEKSLKSLLKPPAQPSATQLSSFIDSHPYVFSNRQRVDVDEVHIAGNDVKILQGVTTLAGAAARLKSVNAQYNQTTRTLDTADMPASVAATLVGQPVDDLFYVHGPTETVAMTITAKTPVAVPAAQQTAIATRLLEQVAQQAQIDTILNRFKAQGHIEYQPRFAPPKGASAPHPSQPPS